MSSLFQEVLNDAKGVEEKLLGPTYPYYKNVKTHKNNGCFYAFYCLFYCGFAAESVCVQFFCMCMPQYLWWRGPTTAIKLPTVKAILAINTATFAPFFILC